MKQELRSETWCAVQASWAAGKDGLLGHGSEEDSTPKSWQGGAVDGRVCSSLDQR